MPLQFVGWKFLVRGSVLCPISEEHGVGQKEPPAADRDMVKDLSYEEPSVRVFVA